LYARLCYKKKRCFGAQCEQGYAPAVCVGWRKLNGVERVVIQVGDRVLVIGYVVLLDYSAEKMTGHGVFSFFCYYRKLCFSLPSVNGGIL